MWILKSIKLTMMCFVCFSAAACSHLIDPCDVLVPMQGEPATNAYIVQNDKAFAQSVARHRGRFEKYQCEGK